MLLRSDNAMFPFVAQVRKQIVQDIQKAKAGLEHIWNWRELESGCEITVRVYDQVMLDAGRKAEMVEEQLAAVQAQISVREKRQKAKAT